MGEVRTRGGVWWNRYYRNGRRHEESARTDKYEDAATLLKVREGAIANGDPSRRASAGCASTTLAESGIDKKLSARTQQLAAVPERWLVVNVNVPRREHFDQPERICQAWTLTKGARYAICEVWSHELGFELRLTFPGDPLPRTRVCKSQEDLIDIQDQWRAALTEKGWV